MKQLTIVALLTALVWCGAMTPPAQAQADPENIDRYYVISVKPGAGGQFEAAWKAYVDWRKAQGDPWTWFVFVAVNGDALGEYLVYSADHVWADLDAYAETDPDPTGAQFWASVGQYVDTAVSRISQGNSSVSNMPDDLSEYTLYRVTSYEMRDAGAFMAAVGKFHAAAQQAHWPGHYGFATVIGGPPAVTIAVPARDWAGFKPPEQTGPELLAEVYGADGAAELFEAFGRSWRSAPTSTWQIRPDLSLVQEP